ncbi:MAG: hypothetical protein OQL06_11055 [Gammaproteobacteria bacterium]|nr:hypothetical protein [Gammaproteobacteria bacterium]
MCIAFPYGRQNMLQRGILSRGWWYIAREPLRLYSFAALFHGLIMLVMILSGHISLRTPEVYSLGLFAAFGVFGWLIPGYILQQYPHWFRCSTAEYANYGMAYNLAFIALLIAEMGLFNNTLLNVIAYILLALGWLVSLHAIRWMVQWGYGIKQTVAPYVSLGLQLVLWLMLAAVPVSLLRLSLIEPLLLIAASVLILGLLAGLLRLRFQTSQIHSR